MTTSETKGTALIAAILVTGLTAQTLTSYRMRDLYPSLPPSTEENASRWDVNLFRVVSFGQLSTAIDWIWLRVLLDNRIDHVAPGIHPRIYYDLDLITDLELENFESYQAGTNLLAVIRNDALGAEKLIKKGETFRRDLLPSYPEKFRSSFWKYSWGVPLLLAYVELFELGDLTQASGAFQAAAKIPGAPAYLERLSQHLESPGGVYEVGLRLLNFMIQRERDEKTRTELAFKRDSLFISQYMFDLNHEFGSFLRVNPKSSVSDLWFYRFLRESRLKASDPWGGRLHLDQNGRIVTTTPHQKVFGLD